MRARVAGLVLASIILLACETERVRTEAGSLLDPASVGTSEPLSAAQDELKAQAQQRYADLLSVEALPRHCGGEVPPQVMTKPEGRGLRAVFFEEHRARTWSGAACCEGCAPCLEAVTCQRQCPRDACVEHEVLHQLRVELVMHESGRFISERVDRRADAPRESQRFERLEKEVELTPDAPRPTITAKPPRSAAPPFVGSIPRDQDPSYRRVALPDGGVAGFYACGAPLRDSGPVGDLALALDQALSAPPRPRGELSIGALKLPPSPEVSVVERFLHSRRASLLQCYEKSLRRAPAIAGVVSLRFQLTTAGRTNDIEATAADTLPPEVADCVRATVRGWVVPIHPAAARPFSVELRFTPLN